MNTIIAAFGNGIFTTTAKVFQWDEGDKLQIVGVDLPEHYKVDFANSLSGTSMSVMGGADGVTIPAEFFKPGSMIYAWVVIPDSDGRYTKYQVNIPIYQRAEPTDEEPTPEQQSALDEAISALNDAEDVLRESGITPEEREKLAGIEAGAEVNVIDEIRHYDSIRDIWIPYPVENKGVNLPDPVIPERIAVFDFTVDAEDLTVTTTVNPSSIPPYQSRDNFVSVAEVQYGEKKLLLPLMEWHEYPLVLFFCGKISDTETMCLSYDAPGDSWIATVDTFGQQYVDELATDLQEQIGNLSDLQTTVKSDLVSAINEVAESGGGGGSSDYDDLSNKPSIEGVTLSGNKTAAQLGLAKASDIPTVPVQSVNGKTGAVVLNASDVGAGTYSKPSGGIPKTDLASAVQTSLAKADTALQTAPVTSVNGQTGAVTLSIPSTASDVGAVAVAQGVAHAGEFVVVGSDGNITTVTMSVWQGGSY